MRYYSKEEIAALTEVALDRLEIELHRILMELDPNDPQVEDITRTLNLIAHVRQTRKRSPSPAP